MLNTKGITTTTKRNKNLAAKDHPSANKIQTHKHNALGSLNLTLD
jgi:hypothetical protein